MLFCGDGLMLLQEQKTYAMNVSIPNRQDPDLPQERACADADDRLNFAPMYEVLPHYPFLLQEKQD